MGINDIIGGRGQAIAATRLTRICRGDNVPYFLDANPNPDISDGEELASAAALVGMNYGDLISRIIGLGLRRGAIATG